MKISNLSKYREIYQNGGNIIKHLRANENSNSIEDILVSYDLQSGSYIEFTKNNFDLKMQYCNAIAEAINKLDTCNSILEAGVGEATTLCHVLQKLNNPKAAAYGFDLSWSRIQHAKKYLAQHHIQDTFLCTGDLFNSPFADNSFDVVYTSHSIEPNGGREEEALKELYRITKHYLVLVEPAYEFADTTSQNRMKEHGYVTYLNQHSQNLGYDVIQHQLLGVSVNPLNPSGITIIRKNTNTSTDKVQLVCPITRTNLHKFDDCYYSPEALLAYPIIKQTGCLLPNNAIVATHFEQI